MSRGIARAEAGDAAALLQGYRASVGARRRGVLIGLAGLALAVVLSGLGAEVRPTVLWDGLPRFFSYFVRLSYLDTGDLVWTDPAYWFWGLRRWSILLGQTLLIAYVATVAGTALGLAGGLLATRNISRNAAIRFVAQRALEIARTVPDIVFALVFVVAFGLGPLPGVLAVMLHTAGTLGKLFAETIENIDMRPVEGIQSVGGGWPAQVRFGVLPQVVSNLASYALLRFEINVRGATVIGFVGAGGIGMELLTAIRKFYYGDVSAILLMLLACVMLIDFGTERLRAGLLADRRRRPGVVAMQGVLLAALLVTGAIVLDLSPVQVWRGLGSLGTIGELMLPPSSGGHFALYIEALWQTLSIACLGTVGAALCAAPIAVLAARNVVGNALLHVGLRRLLDVVRSIDVLIWALIWIDVVGLGPFAGALAIATSDFGALAKLMAEAIEATERGPAEGVIASGGGAASRLRFGILPQVLPVLLGQMLYFFESNARSATIIGIVGAGGIGLHLFEQIRVLEWQQVSFLILMVLVTVAVIDAGSRQLRMAVAGRL